MNIYIRKIIKVGRSGLAIFLPISWTRGENLQAGNFLELKEDGERIVIRPKKRPTDQKPGKKEIHESKKDP
jgi:hypothetical protein